MKIILPMAGKETVPEGSQYILSLYEIERETVLSHIYNTLKDIEGAEFIAVLRREDIEKYHLNNIVRLLIPDVKIVSPERDTMGSACTAMLGIDYVEDDEPMIIAATNQLFTDDAQQIVKYFQDNDYDGGAVTFEDIHPKYSYVKVDEDGLVIEAAEKRPISKNATAGFYYFKRSQDFVNSTISMIRKNASVNGLFYLCPVFNEMILEGKRIGVYPISRDHYFFFKEKSGIDAYQDYLSRRKAQ